MDSWQLSETHEQKTQECVGYEASSERKRTRHPRVAKAKRRAKKKDSETSLNKALVGPDGGEMHVGSSFKVIGFNPKGLAEPKLIVEYGFASKALAARQNIVAEGQPGETSKTGWIPSLDELLDQ